MLFGRPPRPRRASVCPLDIGGLIGVSRGDRLRGKVTQHFRMQLGYFDERLGRATRLAASLFPLL